MKKKQQQKKNKTVHPIIIVEKLKHFRLLFLFQTSNFKSQ